MIQARFEDLMTIASMQGEGAEPWEIVDALPYAPPQARSVVAVCTGVITSDNEVGSRGWAEMMTWLTDDELAEIGIDRQEIIDEFEERYGERSLMASEFQEHLHPRGKGGKWVKKIKSAVPDIPAAPGTTPIPPGYVRLYHYFGGVSPETIAKEGIRLDKARGQTYGEPNVVWASAQMPDPEIKNFVEFTMSWEDLINSGGIGTPFPGSKDTPENFMARGGNVAFSFDIKPDKFIAVHEKWHNRVRFLEDYKDDVLKGDFDWVFDGDKLVDEARAVRYIKSKYGAGEGGSGPRPSGMDAMLPPEKLKLLTDIPIGARVRVTRKESGYVREGILFRRRFGPNANQQTIGILATDEDTGEIQGPINLAFDQMEIERLDDGPVDLATLRQKTLATLDPWEAPPPKPTLVPPEVPDDFFAKRFKEMMKQQPVNPPLKAADFKKGGRFDWLNHPDTYEFQRAKQLAQPTQMEIAREWAEKWFKENNDPATFDEYEIENEPQMSTKSLPDWERPITPEFTQWLWDKYVEDQGLENHPEPTDDPRWRQRFSDWLTFQSTHDLLSNAVRYGHYGSYVDNEDEVHRTATEALKPIFNDENMQGIHIWGAGPNVQFPSGMIPVFEGWNEETKSWSSIRWKDAEPGWEMSMVLTPKQDESKYWYESHTGQYQSLSIVPSERARVQESKVRAFGRLVFESDYEAIESDPETARIRASVSAIDEKVSGLRKRLDDRASDEAITKKREAAKAAFAQIWADLKNDYPEISDKEQLNPDDPSPSFLIGIISRNVPDDRKTEYTSRVTRAITARDAGSNALDSLAKIRELGEERSKLLRRLDAIKRKHWRETMSSMGIEMADEVKEHYYPGEGPNVALDIPNNDLPALRASQSAYPKAWIEASNRRGQLAKATVSTGDKYYGRGFYRDYGMGSFSQGPGTIWLPQRSVPSTGDWGKEPEHVGVHELGHRMEYTIPGITAMEAAFHYSRTKNDKVEMYANDEWVKPDRFTNRYSGKLYQGDSWEIFTMAMQSLYPYSSMEGIDDKQWEQDPDYLALAAGLVALR